MKTNIKNPLTFLVNTEKNNEMIISFNCIVEAFTTSNNIEEAKQRLESELPDFHSNYFSIDLGNNNKIIVKQKKFPSQNFSSIASREILIFSS